MAVFVFERHASFSASSHIHDIAVRLHHQSDTSLVYVIFVIFKHFVDNKIF